MQNKTVRIWVPVKKNNAEQTVLLFFPLKVISLNDLKTCKKLLKILYFLFKQTLNQVTSGIVQVVLQSQFSCSRTRHFGVSVPFGEVSF